MSNGAPSTHCQRAAFPRTADRASSPFAGVLAGVGAVDDSCEHDKSDSAPNATSAADTAGIRTRTPRRVERIPHHTTRIVSVCVTVDTAFLAVMVNVQVPAVVGVPESRAVPLPAVNVTPGGSAPLREMLGEGQPDAVIVNDDA
jgi:hypothetical protein